MLNLVLTFLKLLFIGTLIPLIIFKMKESISINENFQGKESKKLEMSKKLSIDVSSSSAGHGKM